MAFVLGDERRDEGVHAVDDADHVHLERPFPIVQVVLPDVALGAGADGGVVADHVDGAEA